MLDKQFDNIINQKLKDFKLDVPESDWNVFSQKLKVAMENIDPKDQLFDEAIKLKLASADIDIPKPEWNALAAMLYADTQSDTNTGDNEISDADFDAAIKDKVTNPDIEIPKADWPVMASLIAGSIPSPDLSDHGFDNAIQNKLQNNSIDIPSPNWNDFSQKLQEASLSDQDLDLEVKTKLENYSTRFNESHWSILRDKMIETKYLRRNLYGLKWFEGALAILLFMTFSNFIADKFIPDSTNTFATTETSISNVANISAENNALNNTETNIAPATTIASAEAISNNTTITHNTTSNIQLTKTVSSSENSLTENKNSSESNNYASGSNIAYHDIAASNSENNLIFGLNTDLVDTNNQDLNQATSVDVVALDEDHLSQATITTLDRFTLGLFDNERDQLNLDLTTNPVIKVIENNKNNGWALHATIGNNNHMISSPQDTFVYDLPYTRSSKNLNFDVRVAREFNHVALMTGIAYEAMQYGTRVKETITADNKDFEINIANIRYDFVKIPLAARWNYDINSKLNFFADLGVSANILASTKYDIEANEISTSESIPKPEPIEDYPDDVFASYENSSTARKNFQEGFFQGASLKESIHGTLDTGLGINYKLNNRFETYARGSVSQALGQFQVGPNHDTFTSYGLQLGLKYKLGK